MSKHERHIIFLLLSLVLALAVFSGFGGWRYYLLYQDKNVLLDQAAELEGELAVAKAENKRLADELNQQQAIVAEFREQLENFAGTVNTLDKLSKTDPELLQKYSKVYFLNEYYVPESLVLIDEEFMYDPAKPIQVNVKVWPYLKDLLQTAKREGLNLQIVSGYRSFNTQSGLKSAYRITYGEGANLFSADQGYSEHQLGTTVDFTEAGLNSSSPLSGFDKTDAYRWLSDNAHRFGFVLSYPEDNQYYVFEPWHWRFVGVKLATDLNLDGTYFYDLDQRRIDAYLVNLFD